MGEGVAGGEVRRLSDGELLGSGVQKRKLQTRIILEVNIREWLLRIGA
jgi:hypothetical protein